MDSAQIIALLEARSETAIELAQRQFGPMCRGIARNLLKNDEDVEECLNDTWHALWNAIPPQRPDNLAAFAAKITRNLAMKRLAYLRAEKRQVQIVPYDELSQCLPAGQTPEELLMGKELAQSLGHFLNKLDRNSRDLFLRRYWFFDSIETIARGFGMSEGRVTTKLYRIRKKLKDHLAKEAGIYVR